MNERENENLNEYKKNRKRKWKFIVHK
jgi:hypothetical protein